MLNKAFFILGILNTYCNKLAGRLSHLQSWGLCSATAMEQFCYTTVLGQYLIESIQQTLTELQKYHTEFQNVAFWKCQQHVIFQNLVCQFCLIP